MMNEEFIYNVDRVMEYNKELYWMFVIVGQQPLSPCNRMAQHAKLDQ